MVLRPAKSHILALVTACAAMLPCQTRADGLISGSSPASPPRFEEAALTSRPEGSSSSDQGKEEPSLPQVAKSHRHHPKRHHEPPSYHPPGPPEDEDPGPEVPPVREPAPPSQAPEPDSLVLLGMGALAWLAFRRRPR